MRATLETDAAAAPRAAEPEGDLGAAEIEARLAQDGFPELRWLWQRFKASGLALAELDSDAIARSREEHMAPISERLAMFLGVLACSAVAAYLCLQAAQGSWLDAALRVWSALLDTYALCFGTVTVYRAWVRPWSAIAAADLADMLRRRSYRAWVEASPGGRRVARRLSALGVGERWDDPGYRVWLTADGDCRPAPRGGPSETVHQALREVLGAKEDGQYRPGRYSAHLKEGKQSVTRFLEEQRDAVAAAREGRLAGSDGARLLQQLRESEVVSGSAGDRYLADAARAAAANASLPPGVVQAAIWRRDPWVDLTRAQDYFSSASLRGGSWREALERRTKGALGPFGYLRNKSISALDFSTSEGRSLRARLAAAVARDASGAARPVLFVDAVEGRFDLNPALVRRAIEEYARSARFDRVVYHAFPLNQVPARFVERLARAGGRLEEVDLEYLDAERPEYLDAFGLPLEPFEYARPAGRVLGYVVDLSAVAWGAARAGWARAAFRRLRGKALLRLLVVSSFACFGWSLSLGASGWLAAGLAGGAALWHDAWLGPWLRRRRAAAPAEPPRRWPAFVERIAEEIGRDPVARKTSYPARLGAKVEKLLACFPRPPRSTAPFFEEVLWNLSIKESHLENALRFARGKSEDDRRAIAGLLGWLWPREEAAKRVGMSEDRPIRDRAMKDALDRLDRARRYVADTPRWAWRAGALRLAAFALGLDPEATLTLIETRPRLLRGLLKPPRPLFSWVAPALASVGAGVLALAAWPRLAPAAVAAAAGLATAAGTWWLSTCVAIAPGILWYRKTGGRLREIRGGGWRASAAVRRLRELGIAWEEYARGRVLENPGLGVRVEIRDKRTLEGAAQFLASSEEIGNCIALRHFVSWCLPSLLNDETVMLADVSMKGSNNAWRQRAQVWMVAAERAGEPVLDVNSVEFNDEGAQRAELLLPEIVAALQDVARRAGFKAICLGISTFGRAWLDARFPQAPEGAPIVKVHDPELGWRYYFDAFALRAGRYEHVRSRSWAARAYGRLFGLLERAKGNAAKGDAMVDSAEDAGNCWEIPVSA